MDLLELVAIGEYLSHHFLRVVEDHQVPVLEGRGVAQVDRRHPEQALGDGLVAVGALPRDHLQVRFQLLLHKLLPRSHGVLLRILGLRGVLVHVMLLVFDFLQHVVELVLQVLTHVHCVHPLHVLESHLISHTPVLVEAAADGLINLLEGDLGAIGDGGVDIVGLRRPLLHEEEGDIGNITIVDEIFEGVGPLDDTKAPEQLEDDADNDEDGGNQEVEEDAVEGVEVVDGGQVGVSDLGGVRLPVQPHQPEHDHEQKPEHRDGAMRVELSQTVNDEDLSPGVLELALLPVDHEDLHVELVFLVDQHRDQPQEPRGPRHHVEDGIEGLIGSGDKDVEGLGGLGEEEPVAGNAEQEVENPQGPELEEVEEEVEKGLAVEVADVGAGQSLQQCQHTHDDEEGNKDPHESGCVVLKAH